MHIIRNTHLNILKYKVDQSKTYVRNEMSKMKKVIRKPTHHSLTNTYNGIKSDTRVIETYQCSG